MIQELALKLMQIGDQQIAEAELRSFALKCIAAVRREPALACCDPHLRHQNNGRLIGQARNIFKHLVEHKSITNINALELYGTHRIASRIYDIRQYLKIKRPDWKIKCEQEEPGVYRYKLEFEQK